MKNLEIDPVTALPARSDTLSEMPLPSDPKTVFSGGVFLLMLLAAVRVADDIVVPVVMAFFLKLVLQPVLRFLEKLHIPRTIAALLILAAVISLLLAFGTMLAGPAASWAQKLPNSIPRLQERLGFLSDSVEAAQRFLLHAEDLTRGAEPKVMHVELQGTRLSDRIFTGTRSMISGVLTTLLVLFFLLAAGDTFLRRIVEILPRFKDKRQAVDISQQIEQDMSTYLLTITLMNACVGIATGLLMAACGLGDPLLWGTLAFFLNYIPILGPMVGTTILLLAGLLETSTTTGALLPATLYLLVRSTEGLFLTPFLLAKHFTLNPVLVILTLIFWYWMWGIIGAVLAMPMLTVTKIICDRVQPLMAFGHFLEGDRRQAPA